jgi:hypothetical protein
VECLKKFTRILLDITNKMQRYAIFFITVNALHVSGSFSAHHQELKNSKHNIGYTPSLLTATASVGEFQLCCSSPQTGHLNLSSTPYRQLENQSTKYHTQQPSL